MNVYDPNTPEGREQIRRREARRERFIEFKIVAIPLVTLILIFAIMLIGNELWYGDWECAFVNCVRVQDIKNP